MLKLTATFKDIDVTLSHTVQSGYRYYDRHSGRYYDIRPLRLKRAWLCFFLCKTWQT